MKSFKKSLGVRDTLTQEEIDAGLHNLMRDGIFSQTMVTLTQGTFLIGFALSLGASNLAIGLLAAIVPLAQLIQIPSIYIVEKYRSRRAITAYASAAGRSFWLLVALIPFAFPPDIGVDVLLIALTLSTSISAVAMTSRNSWWRDLVPQERLGAVFSKRIKMATIVSIPLLLAGGFSIDYLKSLGTGAELYAYPVLFLAAFIAGMVSVYFIRITPDIAMAPSTEQRKFTQVLREPFKDSNFRKLINFLGVWNFAVNLAAPFFTVYMLKILGLQMSAVIILMVLSLIVNIAFLRIWGSFSDKFSNKSVLTICGPLFILAIFAWTFTTISGWYILTIPLLVTIHVLLGISTAGVTLASQNIVLKLSPKGRATAYLASSSLVNSFAAGFAPILGGFLAEFFASDSLIWSMTLTTPGGSFVTQIFNFHQWDFVFIIAVLIGIYSIHRLTMVEEVGEVKREIVVQELISEVKQGLASSSTIGGLQRLVQFPYSIVKPVVSPVLRPVVEPVHKRVDKIFRKGKDKESAETDESEERGDESAQEEK